MPTCGIAISQNRRLKLPAEYPIRTETSGLHAPTARAEKTYSSTSASVFPLNSSRLTWYEPSPAAL